MIGTPLTKMEAAVEAALTQRSVQVERVAAGHWRVSLSSKSRNGHVQARLEEDWLALRLPLPDRGRTSWDALCFNMKMRGLGKVTVMPEADGWEASADIPLNGLSNGVLAGRLGEALADIATARAEVGGGRHRVVPADRDIAEETTTDVAALLRESGWPTTIRPSGAAAVRLDVPGEFCQALVEQDEHTRGARLRADHDEVANLSAASREATAMLVLATSAAVRLVRAYADHDAQGAPIGFEVTFSPPVTPTEIGHALAALSVASRMCRRELAVLRDESFAGVYLAVHGRGC